MSALFSMGALVWTAGALRAFEKAGQNPAFFVRQHACGNWGDVDAEDRLANNAALESGDRLFSRYHLNDGTTIYIVTEAEGPGRVRPVTTLLLPEEY